MVLKRSRAILGVTVLVGASASAAEGELLNTPIYSPASKSYFELVDVKDFERHLSLRTAPEVRWETAVKLAEHRVFHDVHGRLAEVKSTEVHLFLMQTFRPHYGAWIGLRYLCKSRQLQWVTGESQPASGFRAWHPVWEQSAVGGCSTQEYLAVMYTPVREGFRWITKGVVKEEGYYFVEYPTGGP